MLHDRKQHYLAATDTSLGDLNQTVLNKIHLDDDEIIGTVHRRLHDLLSGDLPAARPGRVGPIPVMPPVEAETSAMMAEAPSCQFWSG